MMARGVGKGGGGDYSREAVNRRSTAIIRVVSRNVPGGEERGETDVFAGYYSRKYGISPFRVTSSLNELNCFTCSTYVRS